MAGVIHGLFTGMGRGIPVFSITQLGSLIGENPNLNRDRNLNPLMIIKGCDYDYD